MAATERSLIPSRFLRRDYNLSPLLVFYEVTRACGLVCKHCRACAQTKADPRELSQAESFRLIDQLADFPQPPMLILTGGDPFCRADIFDLIQHATALGLEVSITPSATQLVTKDAIQRLQDAGIHRLAISLDGAHAELHDEIRGIRGSFTRSLEILSDAKTIGLPTQVNTTVTPENIDQLDELADMLGTLGIVLWSAFFLVPVGRAMSAPRLQPAEYERAFEKLWRHAKQQPYLIKTTEAPHYRRFVLQHERGQHEPGQRSATTSRPTFRPTGVNDGKGVMFVSHTGKVHPSGFMPIDCGSFPSQHIMKIYQDSPIFQELRDPNQLLGKCHACEYRNLCGGSRARAYALTGDPFAEEPDCSYIPLTLD